MIDSAAVDLISEPVTQRLVKQAIALLAASGVLRIQESLLKEALLAGDSTESDETLTESIRQYRRHTQQLQTLGQLGQQYEKELES